MNEGKKVDGQLGKHNMENSTEENVRKTSKEKFAKKQMTDTVKSWVEIAVCGQD